MFHISQVILTTAKPKTTRRVGGGGGGGEGGGNRGQGTGGIGERFSLLSVDMLQKNGLTRRPALSNTI